MPTIKKLVPLCLLILLSLACNAVNLLPGRSTATPTITPSPTITPTPTATPTPTPTPTPVPAARVIQGDQAIFNGDWDTALREYQTALDANPDPKIQSAARLGIGRVYYQEGDYMKAQATLEDLLIRFPASPHLSLTYFYLAQTYTALQYYLKAAETYQEYLDLGPSSIDGYIYEFQGDALFAGQDYSGAIQSYQQAKLAGRETPDLGLDIKIAQSYDLSGDYATAVVGYQDIYQRSSNDYTKARMDLLMGQAYTNLGDLDMAYKVYSDAVNNFPLSNDSYQALVTLVENGIPVNELDRGLVDYYAGQYSVAVAAFDRYLISNPEDPATAHYYEGLSFDALGDHQAAISEWNRVIQDYPDSRFWADAWENKANTQWGNLDDFIQASQTFIDFVDAHPSHPKAAEFLFNAASINERANRLDQAADLWERVATEFPGSDQAYRAYFLAGISHYRLGDYPAAYTIFQTDLPFATDLGQRAALYYWSGKCQEALGDPQSSRSNWEQAAALDPTGYYSERARDMLTGFPAFTPPEVYDLSYNLEAERGEAEAWIRTVFNIPEEVDLSGPGVLVSDDRFKRGDLLWGLGLYSQARGEFEDLRQSVNTDPVGSYRLANHLIEIGLYRTAIFAARQVLDLAGMDDSETLSAPIYFNHIRFGAYYRDLVISAAQNYNFHPLFLFSMIRQESLFEGFVHSSANARGLMQIIPSTGEEIATKTGWPVNYTSDDLYRPIISITFGNEYLDWQRSYLDGDMFGALAAYNAGPGNAMTWKNLAPNDPDLFLEVIRFSETRDYIQHIYENFKIYSRIYNRTP